MNRSRPDEMAPSIRRERGLPASTAPTERQNRPEPLVGFESHDHADLAARFFRALSDPTRIRILHELIAARGGEASVGDLVARIGATQSRTSTHLVLAQNRWTRMWYAGGMRPPIFVRSLTGGERHALEQGLRSSDAFVL